MDIRGKGKEVVIRLVKTSNGMQAACDLINDRYSWRGYGARHCISSDANHITFTAEVGENVIGTITLAVDSAHGLAVDHSFKDQIDQFRALPASKICELTKFAFEPSIQSKRLMAALFHIVFVYGSRAFGCTDLFIEVHSRHVRFYQAMLGFEPVGSLKLNESVGVAAQLMWVRVATIRRHISRLKRDEPKSDIRSLYRFFFSPTEERRIYRLLTYSDGQLHASAGAFESSAFRQRLDSPDHWARPQRSINRAPRTYRGALLPAEYQARLRLILRRRMAAPTSPKPPSIKAQVPGSGTPAWKVAVPS
jgi:hypothetical protein